MEVLIVQIKNTAAIAEPFIQIPIIIGEAFIQTMAIALAFINTIVA